MDDAEAISVMNDWLRYLDLQRAKAKRVVELAALAKTGPEGQADAQRQLSQIDRAPRVYDGARLEPAVKYAVRRLKLLGREE